MAAIARSRATATAYATHIKLVCMRAIVPEKGCGCGSVGGVGDDGELLKNDVDRSLGQVDFQLTVLACRDVKERDFHYTSVFWFIGSQQAKFQ